MSASDSKVFTSVKTPKKNPNQGQHKPTYIYENIVFSPTNVNLNPLPLLPLSLPKSLEHDRKL